MIHSLDIALRLKTLHNVSEIVVSDKVFRQVLEERKLDHARPADPLQLNGIYDSPKYRYLNTAQWHGILFINFSNNFLPDPREFEPIPI